MARTYRARVAAVGSEADMALLCRAMLENARYEEEPPRHLDGLTEAIRRLAAEEGGPDCGFLYEMITRRTHGSAEEDTCRFTVRQEPSGLWTALFCYDSQTPFQPEDWLRLHARCNRLPMLILRACEDFDREKGLLALTGGRVQEEWSRMEECWLWLMTRYGEARTEETGRQLMRLSRLMEDEEYELSVHELLTRCGRFLTRLRERTADAELLRAQLTDAANARDYQTLFSLQCLIAEAALWEAEQADRWLRCIEALQAAL